MKSFPDRWKSIYKGPDIVGERIPRVFKEHQIDLYGKVEWPRGSIVRDEIRIVYESKGIVDHAVSCFLQEGQWLLLSVKCGAIGEFWTEQWQDLT